MRIVLFFAFVLIAACFQYKNIRFQKAPVDGRHQKLKLLDSISTSEPCLNERLKWSRKLQASISALSSVTTMLFLSSASKVLADEVPSTISTPATSDGFIETESGLKYRDIQVGEGNTAVAGQVVRIHYTGWLEGFDSDKKFDSSYDRRSPLQFKVGAGQVIAGKSFVLCISFVIILLVGWDEAILTNFRVGGKREVIIPPKLGYGTRGAGGVIPPNATLYFRMEFVNPKK